MLYFKALLEGLSPLPAADVTIRAEIEMQAKQSGWKAIHKRLQEVDPISAARIHPNDPQRLSRALEVFLVSGKSLTELTKIVEAELPYNVLQFAISPQDRKILHQRIEMRFLQMLNAGFEDEVSALYARGISTRIYLLFVPLVIVRCGHICLVKSTMMKWFIVVYVQHVNWLNVKLHG